MCLRGCVCFRKKQCCICVVLLPPNAETTTKKIVLVLPLGGGRTPQTFNIISMTIILTLRNEVWNVKKIIN